MLASKVELDKAIQIFSGKLRLRKALRCSRDEFCAWYDGRQKIPVEQALVLHEITEGVVRLSSLRPDIWGMRVIKKMLEEEGYFVTRLEDKEG